MRKSFSVLFIAFFICIVTFAQPVIQSFSPLAGPVGTSVLIKGSGFSSLLTGNTVFFGATRASVLSCTDTTVNVSVPVGATYQPITVTTNNLTAYSGQPFLVTFGTGVTTDFTSNSFLPKVDVNTSYYPHAILVADFNLDGKSDLMVSKGSSGTVSVLKNTSTTTEVSFAALLELPATGNNHEGAASADLDGDGKIDFVLTNSNNLNSISIFRNTSTASTISFSTKFDLPTASGPYNVAIGDIDGDGKPDLAAANNGANFITIYKNTSTPGNISFATKIDLPASTYPFGISIADLDADKKPELIYTTQGSSSNLSVMKNISTSVTISFEAPIELAVFSTPFLVSVGDFDGDNKPDLVAASGNSNAIVVKRNTSTPGNLSFSGQQQYFSTARYPHGVAIADLDGDGKPDIASANNFGNSVSALRNTSTPGVISFATAVDYPVGEAPISVAAGDLDGDSRPDLITANSSATSISILRNMIGSNVTPIINSFSPTLGINGTSVNIVGDNFEGATAVTFGGVAAASFIVNSKTSITATVGQGASGDVRVTTALGTASLAGFIFNGPIIHSFSPTVGASGTIVTIVGTNFTNVSNVEFGGVPAASFTVNSATNITAVVGTGASGNVSVITPGGAAALAGFSYGAPTITSFAPLSAPAGSAVTIYGTNFSLTPAENNVFFGAVKATVISSTAAQLRVVVPVSATYSPITVTVNRLTAVSSLPFSIRSTGVNTQLSVSSFTSAGSFSTGNYPVFVCSSDLNDDGKPDLISSNAIGNSISILKNTSNPGNVSFQQKIDLPTGKDPKRIAIGDLNGDGKPDLVASSFNTGLSGSISIFQNISAGGNINFATKIELLSGNGSHGVAINDMNGDGKLDIVVTSGNSGFFSYFQNNSTNTISFDTKKDITLFTHPGGLVLADVDNDGKPDVITANFSGGNISVYRNTSHNGIFSLDSRVDYAAFSFANNVSVGDLDGDGKLDIIVNNSSQFSYLKNNSTPGLISLASAQDFALAVTNVSFGDLNGDGKVDLCAGRWLNGKISTLENLTESSENVVLGANIEHTTGNYDTYTTIADFDGDNKPDLAAANTTSGTVTILRNSIGEPYIIGLSSVAAHKGQTISLNGENFTGATDVKFGGTRASSFTVISENRIDAVVSAGTSGAVSVTTPNGTATYQNFRFLPEIIVGGSTNFCNGDSVALTSTASHGNQWYKDGVIINGATSTLYQAKASGKYSVRTTGNNIVTSSASDVTVVVTTVSAPTITVSSNELTSSVATGNQWYLDGTLLNGATNSTYQPTMPGSYTVQATVNGCLGNPSLEYNYALAGTINIGNNQFVGMYPNPTTNNLTIRGNFNDQNNLIAEVSDMYGKIVLTTKTVQIGQTIDISKLKAGYYFVNIYSADLKLLGTIKILKID